MSPSASGADHECDSLERQIRPRRRATSEPARGEGEFDVAVELTAKPAVNGMAHKPTPEELGWPPGFFENVIGSIDDDTFMRHPQGEYEKREELE